MKYISLTQPFLYASIITSACSAILSVVVGRWILRDNGPGILRSLGLILLLCGVVADQFVYQEALRSEPWFHLGFYPSVVLPVIAYGFILLLVVFFAIRALWKGLSPSHLFLSLYVPITLLMLFDKITFGIAYASPAAGLLVGVDVLIVILRLVFRPQEPNKDKQD